MSTFEHPITGVPINAIPIVRSGGLNDKERATARHLIAEGDARWLAAAKLGCHPLAFKRDGAPKRKPRPPSSRHLSAKAAATDPRQMDLEEAIRAAIAKDTSPRK